MRWLLYLAGFAGGGALAVQAGINAQLARGVGHPVLASAISFLSGMTAIWAIVLLGPIPFPDPTQALARVPWYAWFTGGLLGAFYLTVVIWLTPQLGAAAVVVMAIGGQILAAVLLDHFGLLRLPQNPATPLRLLGACLVLLGVWLVVRRP